MKKLLLVFCAGCLVACHPAARLEPGNWDPSVRKALNTLMKEQAGKGAYAVFDFD